MIVCCELEVGCHECCSIDPNVRKSYSRLDGNQNMDSTGTQFIVHSAQGKWRSKGLCDTREIRKSRNISLSGSPREEYHPASKFTQSNQHGRLPATGCMSLWLTFSAWVRLQLWSTVSQTWIDLTTPKKTRQPCLTSLTASSAKRTCLNVAYSQWWHRVIKQGPFDGNNMPDFTKLVYSDAWFPPSRWSAGFIIRRE